MTAPRQGRLVVLLNAGISVALIAVISGIGVLQQDANPPGIAEFAPLDGRTALSTASATAQPAPLVRDRAEPLPTPAGARGVPSSLRCYGWPDGSTTQTLDPQSPPCIASWAVAAGNGGATATGVTGSAVRVGVFGKVGLLPAYARWFSSHFQLYGRRLEIVALGAADLASPSGQAAAAVAAAQQDVFAVLLHEPSGAGGPPTGLLSALAGKGVLAVLGRPSELSTTALSALSPYVWSYAAGADQVQRATASFLCEQLVGRSASFSPSFRDRSRRLGLLVPEGTAVDVLVDGLDACHSAPEVEQFTAGSASAARDAVLRLRVAGVTTVLPYSSAEVAARLLLPAAEAAGFRPEWVLAGVDEQPSQEAWAKAPAAQTRALLGVTRWSRPLAASARPAAVIGGPGDDGAYHALLVLSSGIQLAGPRLTAEDLADGLASTGFANPGAGAAPSFQASVGFESRDHAMVDDVGLAWWRDSGFCLVPGRFSAGQPPVDDPGLFTGTRGCP